MSYIESEKLFEKAQLVIPGGVNSPVRAFAGVGGTPPFITHAEGAYLFDVDGNRYIDYVGSWGPMILGHADPTVVEAIQKQAAKGLSFGAPTELEVRMAEKLCELVPSLEQVRMVNSGTEATMSAIRLARGFTGRNLLVKFEGCYHGHADPLLVKAGSGALTLGVPTSPGVPEEAAVNTLTLQYNNPYSVRSAFAEHRDKIACVIVEPVAGNMNCIPPAADFLESLREECDRYGSVLIFDEVMTGFRVALGGAQEKYGITPDLTTLGKIVGGGMPVGAFGGRRDIMQQLAPVGPIYQAGTLSGNPLAMAAGLATLEALSEPGFYSALETKTRLLCDGLANVAKQAGVDVTLNQVGGMFGLFFSSEKTISRFEQVMNCDKVTFAAFFHHMLQRGVNLAPSAFEAGFLSRAHSAGDIAATIQAASESFSSLGIPAET